MIAAYAFWTALPVKTRFDPTNSFTWIVQISWQNDHEVLGPACILSLLIAGDPPPPRWAEPTLSAPPGDGRSASPGLIERPTSSVT